MRVIILGAGEMGFHTARTLAAERHDVVLIDLDEAAVQRVQENLDVLALHGSGASPRLLQQAGLSETNLLIAVTNDDETNIVACLIAAKHGVATKVARVSSSDYFANLDLFSPEDVHIDLWINPEYLSAQEFLRLLSTPEAREIVEFAHGRVRLVAFRIPEENPIQGQSLNVLRKTEVLPNVLFTAIKRRDGQTVIPRGHDTVSAGDEVFAIGSSEAIGQLMELFGVVPQKLNRVVIAGGGRIGVYLAEALEERGVQVSLIEPDLRVAEAASTALRRTRVLCGGYLDEEILLEAGVEEAEGFVGATGEDETDILACVAAKQLGAKRVLALVQKPRNLPLLASIPTIDGAVSRHLTAVSHILKLVRRGKIVSVASLHEIQAEVLELLAGERSPITRKPIKAVKFPPHALIGAIVRGDRILVPSGSDQVHPGDRAVVFCMPEAIPAVEQLFVSP